MAELPSAPPNGWKKILSRVYNRFKKNKSYGFSFKIAHARKLKYAIEALADNSFNPTGLGLLEVSQFGFNITVSDTNDAQVNNIAENGDNLYGFLQFWKHELGEFYFQRSSVFVSKMISLSRLSEFLNSAPDDATIVVQHDMGNGYVAFKFTTTILGRKHKHAHRADFVNSPLFNEFFHLNYEEEIVIQAAEYMGRLINIINMAPGARPQIVVAAFQSTNTLAVGEVQRATIEWNHWDSIHKASRLGEMCYLRYSTYPQNGLLLHFELEPGVFVYYRTATELVCHPVFIRSFNTRL